MDHLRRIQNIEIDRYNEGLKANVELIYKAEPKESKETQSTIKAFIYSVVDPYNMKPFQDSIKLAYELSTQYVKELV